MDREERTSSRQGSLHNTEEEDVEEDINGNDDFLLLLVLVLLLLATMGVPAGGGKEGCSKGPRFGLLRKACECES